ncbi:MAG: class I SAM-dependent methyltransferase [Planctomycetota bacterium]
MADKADRFRLYEQSVQMPDHEVSFLEQAYHEARRRAPVSLAEDFCGTFAVSCEWVKSGPSRTAVAVDNCGDTLQWGRDNNLPILDEGERNRITLKMQDARTGNSHQVDVLASQNFSFWIFKTRSEVLDYFRSARSNLTDDGVIVLDMFGGAECRTEGLSHRTTVREGKDGFRYDWTQVSFNPINSDLCCSISFAFPDGSRMRDAFVYHWRLWTIAEVRELLSEAGFATSYVYWAIESEEDLGWQRRETAPSDASWTCYVVGLK